MDPNSSTPKVTKSEFYKLFSAETRSRAIEDFARRIESENEKLASASTWEMARFIQGRLNILKTLLKELA